MIPIRLERYDQEIEPVRKRMPLLSCLFSILAPDVAAIPGVGFHRGVFDDAAQGAYYNSSGEARWRLESNRGLLEVTFERADGYLFGLFGVIEPYFSQGEAILVAANAGHEYLRKP